MWKRKRVAVTYKLKVCWSAYWLVVEVSFAPVLDELPRDAQDLVPDRGLVGMNLANFWMLINFIHVESCLQHCGGACLSWHKVFQVERRGGVQLLMACFGTGCMVKLLWPESCVLFWFWMCQSLGLCWYEILRSQLKIYGHHQQATSTGDKAC